MPRSRPAGEGGGPARVQATVAAAAGPPAKAPRTALDYLKLAVPYLERHGIRSPRLDAELLLAHVLGLSRLELYLQMDRPLVRAEVDAYRAVLVRRAAREPVAYVTGVKEFYGLKLAVGPGVLVPRPETEWVVELALKALERSPALHPVVDVGTGSGAIALAVASRRPGVSVIGTDRSLQALEYARRNGRSLGLQERVGWIGCDTLRALGSGRAGLVLSNPPYVPTGALAGLEPEITRYEPGEALDGGSDGLSVAREVLLEAARVLAAGGLLLMELGSLQQAEALLEWARRQGLGEVFEELEVRTDPAGGAVALSARRVGDGGPAGHGGGFGRGG